MTAKSAPKRKAKTLKSDPIQQELRKEYGYSTKKKSTALPMAKKPCHLIRGIANNPKNTLEVRERYMSEVRRRSKEGITVNA